MASDTLEPKTLRGRQLFGHPIGLYVLFFVEAWERFSYYGMRALLVYYMTKQILLPGHTENVIGHGAVHRALGFVFRNLSGALDTPAVRQAFSSQIYGLYTALTYLTPVFGGILADRWLGQRRSVFIGGIIMAAGQFCLMSEPLFYLGLFLLVLGNGAFKPNISTQVGALYPEGDPRRDRAFNIFYVGINLGAWASPLICGTLGETYGWRFGFGSAGVGMLLGLVVYAIGQGTLAPDQLMKRQAAGGALTADKVSPATPYREIAQRPTSDLPETKASKAQARWHLLSGALACASGILGAWISGRGIFVALAALGTVQLLWGIWKFWAGDFTKEERLRIFALNVLCLLNVPFWGVYEQQGNTLALFADEQSDRRIFAFLGWNWEMPATWFQSVNPAFIFLFTFAINPLWAWQAKRGKEPSSVAKMALGSFMLAVSFVVMIAAARDLVPGKLVSMWWLIGCTAILTVGEIYLSPVGLSLVTKIAPVRVVSMMMGFWFLSSFFGNYMSGWLGMYWEEWSKGTFFGVMAALALGTGLAFLAFYSPLKKAIGDENAPQNPT